MVNKTSHLTIIRLGFLERKKCWHHLLYADGISFFATKKVKKIPKNDVNS